MSRDPTSPAPDAAVAAKRLTLLAGMLAALLFGLGVLCLADPAPATLRVAAFLAMAAGATAAVAAFARLRKLHERPEAVQYSIDETADAWDGRDRRGPNRARNVARLPKKTSANADPDDDQWEAF